MRDHTKLRAFERADEIAMAIYRITKGFPKEEMFGLTSQRRRAAVSVAANIAEGCGHESQAEDVRFLEIGFGSLREWHYRLGLAQRLGYIDKKDAPDGDLKMTETEKVLGALVRSMRNK